MPKQQPPGISSVHGGAAPTSYSSKGGNGFAMSKSQTPGQSAVHGGTAPRSAPKTLSKPDAGGAVISSKGSNHFAMPPNTTVSTANGTQGGGKKGRQTPSVVVE